MRSCSIFRMRACASTRTSRRWLIAWKRRRKQHIAFFVLDRPNPLGGEAIEGPMLDRDRTSFVGYFPMPVRYAMTMGELAQMFNAENKIGADLHVVAMENWRRRRYYDHDGTRLDSAVAELCGLCVTAFLYPGIEILQAGGVSVGRGTPTPFEVFGAPWIDRLRCSRRLNAERCLACNLRRRSSRLRAVCIAEWCATGSRSRCRDRGAFRSMLMGLEIADALHRLYPDSFTSRR